MSRGRKNVNFAMKPQRGCMLLINNPVGVKAHNCTRMGRRPKRFGWHALLTMLLNMYPLVEKIWPTN